MSRRRDNGDKHEHDRMINILSTPLDVSPASVDRQLTRLTAAPAHSTRAVHSPPCRWRQRRNAFGVGARRDWLSSRGMDPEKVRCLLHRPPVCEATIWTVPRMSLEIANPLPSLIRPCFVTGNPCLSACGCPSRGYLSPFRRVLAVLSMHHVVAGRIVASVRLAMGKLLTGRKRILFLHSPDKWLLRRMTLPGRAYITCFVNDNCKMTGASLQVVRRLHRSSKRRRSFTTCASVRVREAV